MSGHSAASEEEEDVPPFLSDETEIRRMREPVFSNSLLTERRRRIRTTERRISLGGKSSDRQVGRAI